MKNVTTPTAVLSTVDKAGRYSRHDGTVGYAQIVRLANCSDDMTVKMLAQGILYADDTGRIGGTLSLKLRAITPWAAAQLITRMIKDGLSTIAEVPRWLNANA